MTIIGRKFGPFCLTFILIVSTLSSCAPTIQVPVLKPAEINLRGIDKIVIGDIRGNFGLDVADLLSSRLFELDKFDIVDRDNLDQIMREHQLNSSGMINTNTAVKMGELIGASALITGNASLKYGINRSKGKAWTDKEGGYHRTYYIKGTAKVKSTLKVIGLTTGKVLAVKSISKESSDENRADNGWPSAPDRDELISNATNQMLNIFIKMIAPYTIYVKVKFAKSDFPESKAGVTFARQGEWDDAVEQFKLAKNKAPTNPGGWYNLGIAYMYSFKFRPAIQAFKEANKIKPSDNYIMAIGKVKRLQKERKKLERQGAIESAH